MAPVAHLDIVAIERRARQLRAEEIRRIDSLVAAQFRVLGHLLAAGVLAGALAVAAKLRPLVEWNPEVHHHV